MQIPGIQMTNKTNAISDGVLATKVTIVKVTDQSNYPDMPYNFDAKGDLRLKVEYIKDESDDKAIKTAYLFGNFQATWDNVTKKVVAKKKEWDFSARNLVLMFLHNAYNVYSKLG